MGESRAGVKEREEEKGRCLGKELPIHRECCDSQEGLTWRSHLKGFIQKGKSRWTDPAEGWPEKV